MQSIRHFSFLRTFCKAFYAWHSNSCISTPTENWTHVFVDLFTRNSPYYHVIKYLLFFLKHPVSICSTHCRRFGKAKDIQILRQQWMPCAVGWPTLEYTSWGTISLDVFWHFTWRCKEIFWPKRDLFRIVESMWCPEIQVEESEEIVSTFAHILNPCGVLQWSARFSLWWICCRKKSLPTTLGGRMFEPQYWSEGRSPKLQCVCVCRKSVHRININTVQNCTVSAENPCTQLIITQFETAQCLQRIRAQNS